MRIAFLCKRRYMGKDVIDDRYARLYEFPRQLALLGHDVLVECVGYQGQTDGIWEHAAGPGRLRFQARGLRFPWVTGLLAYPVRVLSDLRAFMPDVVVGASDIPNIVLAANLANRLKTPLVVDLYDNFEAFGQARLPGMVGALRRATKSADLVTTTSTALACYVAETYRPHGRVEPVPSTIDKTVFRPHDKAASRAELGLPADAILIGTAGGLHRSKGIGELFDAWALLREDPRFHLVLAGPLDGSIDLPTGPRVHYLGQQPHDRIAVLFSALDVATVCVLDTPFGRYCFPQKAYEILATGTTVVASDVGAMSDLLDNHPGLLYRPGSPASLATRIREQIERPDVVDIPIDDWSAVMGRLAPLISRLVKTKT